ncbi:MAG: putative secreted protein [Bacteroidetes bacterium]|nr:putative secreted protein [Bacteroidota bacterium]
MKKSILTLFAVTLILGFISCGSAKPTAEQEQQQKILREKIQSQNYRFIANFVVPRGEFQPRYLTSEYDLKISKDTVEVYLPYFGVAYQAPVDLDAGGIKFVSRKFDYSINRGKKAGNWIVNIHTHDQRNQVVLRLNIWENGNADLDVNDTSRQSISFRGKVE